MLTGNRSILLAFAVIFNIRLLTELPRALNLMGWTATPGADYNRLFSTLLLAFCVICIIFKNKIVIPNAIGQAVVVLSLLLAGSVAIAIHTFVSHGMPINGVFVVLLRYFIEIVIVVFALNFVKDEQDLNAVYSFLFKPALFFFIFFSLLQVTTSSYGDVQGIERIMGPFGSPTTLAGFLHLFIALTFYFYEGKHSLKFWSLLAIQYILLIYTGSIATVAASLVFISLIAIKQRWIKLKAFYRIAPFVLIGAIGGVIYKMESIILRLSIVFNLENFELTEGSSLKWRWDNWMAYISLLGNNFLNWFFGLGIGTQRFILHPDYPNSLWRLFDSPGTHNDYLAMLVDFGAFGLVLFCIGMVVLYKIVRKAEAKDPGLFYLRFYLVTVLFIMLTENFIDQLIMFVFLLFLTGIINARKNTASDSVERIL